MRIKKITFHFASCFDQCSFDGGYVSGLQIKNIHKTLAQYNQKRERVFAEDYFRTEPSDDPYNPDEIYEYESADFISMKIYKKANGYDLFYDFVQEKAVNRMEKFERIVNGKDISYIDIELVDLKNGGKTKNYKIAANWEYKDNKNPNQKALITKNGNLYLVISNQEELADVFPFIKSPDSEPDWIYGTNPLLAIPSSSYNNKDKLRILQFSFYGDLDYAEGVYYLEMIDLYIDNIGLIPFANCFSDEFDTPTQCITDLLKALYGSINNNHEELSGNRNNNIYKDDIRNVTIVFLQDKSDFNQLNVYVYCGNGPVGATQLNLRDFILELSAEIEENLNFWARSNEDEDKDEIVSLIDELEKKYESFSANSDLL